MEAAESEKEIHERDGDGTGLGDTDFVAVRAYECDCASARARGRACGAEVRTHRHCDMICGADCGVRTLLCGGKSAWLGMGSACARP